MKSELILLFPLLAIIAGCGGADSAETVLVKSTGSLQCSASQTTQARLDAEVASLKLAGAAVSSSSCANDGAARVALCGIDNGDLFSVTVNSVSVGTAIQFGFRPASNYPAVRLMACN